jgi:hypothetical protein
MILSRLHLYPQNHWYNPDESIRASVTCWLALGPYLARLGPGIWLVALFRLPTLVAWCSVGLRGLGAIVAGRGSRGVRLTRVSGAPSLEACRHLQRMPDPGSRPSSPH